LCEKLPSSGLQVSQSEKDELVVTTLVVNAEYITIEVVTTYEAVEKQLPWEKKVDI